MLNDELFRKYTTHGIGLDRFFDEITKKNFTAQPNYPPYNIVRVDDYKYLLELAVAGFAEKDLSIEFADDILRISGNKEDNTVEREYLHKGIGARQFARTFTLSPDVVVQTAALENGLLRILIERIVPEHKKPKSIAITNDLKIDTRISDNQLLMEGTTTPPRTSEVG